MRVVPADPALRSLPSLLPGAGVPDFIAEAAGEAAARQIEPQRGEVVYVRYRPAEECTVVWRLPAVFGPPLVVSATVFSDERGAGVIAGAAFRAAGEHVQRSQKRSSRPYAYFPDRQVLFQAFPLDVRLPALPLAGCGDWLRSSFSACLGVAREKIRLLEATPVSYKPSIRCVFRYTLEVGDRRAQYFGKVFRDERGASLVSPLRALRTQLQACNAPWETPAPLAYFAEGRMLVMEGLESEGELKALFKEAADRPDARASLRRHVARAAAGLGTLQRMAVADLAQVAPPASLRWVGSKMRGLASVNPGLDKAIRQVLAGLEAAASRLPREQMVLTHGAFRYTQCLLRAGGELGVVDLDKLCRSGASADAGEFLARFDMAGLREPRLRPVVAECEEAFVAAVREHASVDPGWLAWYRAVGALKWALYSFLSLSPGWPETTAGLIKAAEHWLGQATWVAAQ